MNKHPSTTQLSNANGIQQGQQQRNVQSYMIQPRNKFHDLPLLFRHNPHHSKQMQSAHQISATRASNISSNCNTNQLPPEQPELKVAGFQSRGISHERPSILSKQPSLNAFLMNSTAQNCLSRNTASTASLPPCTSSSSAFKLSESANSNFASDQSGKQAVIARSAGQNTSAKNEGSQKTFHVSTSAFDSGAITSTLLQAAQQSSTLSVNQHQANQQLLGQSEFSVSEGNKHLSYFSSQNHQNQPTIIGSINQNNQEFAQTFQNTNNQIHQQLQESSSMNSNDEKYRVSPFTPSSIKSEVNNENYQERENEYIYNYSSNARSPVSVIPSKQHQESANRSSSHNNKQSGFKINNVLTFGENENMNTLEDKYTAKTQLQHLLLQNPSPQKSARNFKSACLEDRPSPTRQQPQNLAQVSQFGTNHSKSCFQEGLHSHNYPNQIGICGDCSLRQHSQDRGAVQFRNEQIQTKAILNSKQTKVDTYTSQVKELIPQLVTALKSMEFKSGDVERFLDSQERQIEGGFAQLFSHLTTVKDQLLKTIDTCRTEKRRRYNEINKLCQKSLEDMVNSQQDIQMNYEKIVTEFEEQQVNLVMQTYNDRQQEAWNILVRSRGAELLEVLKFDASTLTSLQDSIGFTALTSLKRLRTTFVKQNNNSLSSHPSPSGSPIGSRSNSKKQISPFRSRKNNSENQKRTPNIKLCVNNTLNESNYNNHNNSINISHCSHGGSISNNSHNNSSFFQNLEASFIQNKQDKGIAQIQQECFSNDKGRVMQRQKSAQSRVKQGTSVYVSFDNQEAFNIPQEQENKENTFTIANGTAPVRQIYNERPSYSNNQQGKVPVVRANFQIPIQEIKNRNFYKDKSQPINKESSQECNNLYSQGMQGAQISQLNIIAAQMGSYNNRFSNNSNNSRNSKELTQQICQNRNSVRMEEIIEEEKQNSTPTETARLFNETQGKQGQKDACTPDFAQVASSSESLQYGQQVQVSSIPGSPHSSKESKLSNRASLSEQQVQKHNKFNEMIKAVQANQIQRNQNCQTILQRVSDSIRDSSSAQSSIQGGQSHNRSDSTQMSSITAANSATRCERASSSHVKLASDASQLKFSLEELLYRPSVDSLNPALQKEFFRYQVPIEEESEKGFNILGETQSSGQKSTVEQGSSKEKPRQFYMPFANPIDY